MEFVVNNAMKEKPTANAFEEIEVKQANIKVMGCGGAGNNMVNWLYKKGIKGAEIIGCNTDQQHLNMIESDRKFLIGKDVTRGLGCGGFPERGAEAAQESMNTIKDALKES
ncbi:cell division protein FtsZ, partial [Candidatus Woesearchaeota archaeon]|nr:cell division protein FtsZ [Candidatus Woesearchaeota archaeon]